MIGIRASVLFSIWQRNLATPWLHLRLQNSIREYRRPEDRCEVLNLVLLMNMANIAGRLEGNIVLVRLLEIETKHLWNPAQLSP